MPTLVSARDLVERFHRMVRPRTDRSAHLDHRCHGQRPRILRQRIVADHRAVTAEMIQPWSNGQTEGQITKLKLVKRQMYGRAAKLDLAPGPPFVTP